MAVVITTASCLCPKQLRDHLIWGRLGGEVIQCGPNQICLLRVIADSQCWQRLKGGRRGLTVLATPTLSGSSRARRVLRRNGIKIGSLGATRSPHELADQTSLDDEPEVMPVEHTKQVFCKGQRGITYCTLPPRCSFIPVLILVSRPDSFVRWSKHGSWK